MPLLRDDQHCGCNAFPLVFFSARDVFTSLRICWMSISMPNILFHPTLRWSKKLMCQEHLPWPLPIELQRSVGKRSYYSFNLADPQLKLTGHCILTSLLRLRKYIKLTSFPLGGGKVKPTCLAEPWGPKEGSGSLPHPDDRRTWSPQE